MMRRWVWLCLLLLPLHAFANVAKATLDRNMAHMGDTVTLNVSIDGVTDASTPDLSALDKDFEVLGTSTNSVLSVVNGQQTMQFIIGIALRPKHVGDLQIPPLTVGSDTTQSLTLHVDAPDHAASADNQKDIFVEVSATPDHVYVGQQLLLRVRLFFDVNISSGTLPDPPLDAADLRKLGGDTDYESVRGGKRYHVIERSYALIAQHPGSLTVPSFEFQGEAIEPGDDAGNPGMPPEFGRFFGNTVPVNADSPPLTIDVKPVPASWGKTAWLPARTLALDLQGFPRDGKMTLGQPINLHMTVQATGLPADVLPAPSLPAIDGAKIYPDPPTATTQDDGQWLTGSRERGFAIFPERAGSLTIPATTLTWFDVQSGQTQVASIPARTLTVVAAANGMPASSSSAPATASIPRANRNNAAAEKVAPGPAAPSIWRWIAVASVAVWLLSIVAFVRWRRRTPARVLPASHHAQVARAAFMQAARGNDFARQAHCLLAWAREQRSDLQNLGQLSAALQSVAQREAIEALQRANYAHADKVRVHHLAAVFAKGFAWRDTAADAGDSPLPPLYPFKLD